MIRDNDGGFRMSAGLASVLCALLTACSPVAPASAPDPAVSPTVRLVDSIPWEHEMGDGYLRRVEVRTGDRLDTIPRVLTYDLPFVVDGTSVVGLAYKDDGVIAGYQFDPRTRLVTRTPVPRDLNAVMSGASLSPDGRHIAYVAFGDSRGRAVVRTWPGREVRLRSDWIEVPATDSPGGNVVRWIAADTVEIFVEANSSAENAWYRVRASMHPARIISADTVNALPD